MAARYRTRSSAFANKPQNDMVRYAVEFGMTPSARSRIERNLKTTTPSSLRTDPK
jgi:hypothetical protein